MPATPRSSRSPASGPLLAAVFVAEIGDVHRFPGPAQLTCWAGLTPSHHESDTTVRRGRITKQGSRPVRWAAIHDIVGFAFLTCDGTHIRFAKLHRQFG